MFFSFIGNKKMRRSQTSFQRQMGEEEKKQTRECVKREASANKILASSLGLLKGAIVGAECGARRCALRDGVVSGELRADELLIEAILVGDVGLLFVRDVAPAERIDDAGGQRAWSAGGVRRWRADRGRCDRLTRNGADIFQMARTNLLVEIRGVLASLLIEMSVVLQFFFDFACFARQLLSRRLPRVFAAGGNPSCRATRSKAGSTIARSRLADVGELSASRRGF